MTTAFALALVAGSMVPALAQADPGEVPDLAVHQGPNSVDPDGDGRLDTFSAHLIVFSDGAANGTAVLRTADGVTVVHQFQTAVAVLDADGGFVVDVTARALGAGGGGDLTGQVRYDPTDIPDCLIWDIADGNVYLEPFETQDFRIQFAEPAGR